MSIKLKNLLAENMRRFGTKNLSEQTTHDAKTLEQTLIDKFVKLGGAPMEYATPGMRNELLNDYEDIYYKWLTGNGFETTDVMLDTGVSEERLNQIATLIKQKDDTKSWMRPSRI